MFYRKGVLKSFAKFPRKHLCQSLFFNKVTGLRPATLLKKRHCEISKNNFSHRTPPVDAFAEISLYIYKRKVHEEVETNNLKTLSKKVDHSNKHSNRHNGNNATANDGNHYS